MGLRYENLDAETRRLMVEEVNYDLANGGMYESRYLNPQGLAVWAQITREACERGTDGSLAALLAGGLLESHYSKRKPKGGMTMAQVPYNAHETMAEAQFNMYYLRALARRVLNGDAGVMVVYRAKAVDAPRSSSEAMIGTTLDPQLVLDELRRTKGVDPDVRVPLPNTGITARLA